MLVPKPHRDNEECRKSENCKNPKEYFDKNECCKTDICDKEEKNCSLFSGSFLKNLKVDDIILIAIIFMFLNDGCEDKSLLLIIGAVFLLGFN